MKGGEKNVNRFWKEKAESKSKKKREEKSHYVELR